MNEVLLLQNQIAVLEQEIIELNAERNGLIGFQIENINALDEVEMQVKRRYKVADKFSQLKRVSTFATKLADKYAEHYGQTKGGALVYQYNEIDRNISKAIMQVDIEIKDKKCEIYRLEKTIAILEMEMNQNKNMIQNNKPKSIKKEKIL